MARKHTPEVIVAKLGKVDVLTGQGQSIAEAVKSIAVTETTYLRWRAEYGGMKSAVDILAERERIKHQTIELRRLQHRKIAA